MPWNARRPLAPVAEDGGGHEVDAAPRSLLDEILEHPELADLDPPARRLYLRRLARERGDEDGGAAAALADEIDGLGPLAPLITDEEVTDVFVNGPDEVWVERAGRLEETDVKFASEEDLRALINRRLAEAGTQADLSHPLAEARLDDGSRIHVALPPVAPNGPLVSIRRFPETAFTLDDLVANGMMDDERAATLAAHVAARRTILISGPTGAGKTTLLGALLATVRRNERVVLVEETSELPRAAPHVVKLVARPPNADGRGAVSLADLVRASLRMRPDRIIIGEVRGEEARVALGALSSGHRGSLLTIHARSARAATDRLVSLAVGEDARREAMLRAQAQDAIDVVVQLERRAAARRVEEILECC